jgi:endonuclease YncB( thermonuclease family)
MHRPPIGLCVPVRLSRVIDGDTIEVNSYTGAAWRIRLIDCWAPERHTEAGKRATAYAQQCLDEARALFAFIPLPELIVGQPCNPLDLATFNRVPGHLFVSEDVTLADLMIRAGHAGRTKETQPK